ncbi:uncharacterized protein METZ01_LOCUS221523, partial [marine metagenome]
QKCHYSDQSYNSYSDILASIWRWPTSFRRTIQTYKNL